jgi:hypothetical protein
LAVYAAATARKNVEMVSLSCRVFSVTDAAA